MQYRQIHLDFHTSEAIEHVGEEFSREQFQAALKQGHVNSVTLFSKCHHGWSYHPTKANRMHPHLQFDLLGAQIAAAHQIGVKTPVYLSAGFDEKTAREHPEWLFRDAQGNTGFIKTLDEPGFHRLCMNTPYLELLLAQTREVLENYDADGLFFDIVGVFPCHCAACTAKMQAAGLDPLNEENAYMLALETYRNYLRRIRQTVDACRPGLPVYHNTGHLFAGRRDLTLANTHLELESLPTGGWGYDHFPLCAAHARTLGVEYLGMTGKFHQSWGEFGGYKHPNALRYETALCAAFGAKCSIGDQMHPRGRLDEATYRLIGDAYAELEEKEPWLTDCQNVADVALLSQEALFVHMHPTVKPPSKSKYLGNTGASRMLLEGKYLFDVVDTEADLSRYKLLIMTDDAVIDERYAEKLRAFTASGGRILASGTSAMLDNNGGFAVDLGAIHQGSEHFCPAYLRPHFEMADLYDAAYVIYEQSQSITACGEVLATKEAPYFNRTLAHFCSHLHAPNDPENTSPAVTRGKDGIYIAFPLFREYAVTGSLIAKRAVTHLIDLLLADQKTLSTDLPAQGVVTLTKQKESRRLINHLLYASPVKRGKGTEVIEDLLPILDTTVRLRLKKPPRRVCLQPQNVDLPFTFKDGLLQYTVPRFTCHQLVVVEL